MDIKDLGEDRFLRKDASQTDQTKSAIYTASNPAPKRGDDAFRKVGRPKGSEEDDGAPNILTGTVIVSCFIQTSALPSRIELQGNDLTFFDDTYEQNGKVIGDTSRLIFTHGSAKQGEIITQGFIFEKRASTFSTYDNVLALYALRAKPGRKNIFYIGRDGLGSTLQLNYMEITVNHDPNADVDALANGMFAIGGAFDGQFALNPNFRVVQNTLIGLSGEGYSVTLGGTNGGLIGIESVIIPNVPSTYDIGSPSAPFRNIYANSIGLPGGVTWTQGTGSPEGVVTAPIGSLYSNLSGGASTTLYVKTSGAGNTGWTAK